MYHRDHFHDDMLIIKNIYLERKQLISKKKKKRKKERSIKTISRIRKKKGGEEIDGCLPETSFEFRGA